MRNRSVIRLCLFVLVATVIVPNVAHAQGSQSGKHDKLWNGMLIGAGIGAVAGMVVAPQALCGSHDTECAVIVRTAIGLPAIAGGIGIGALVDGMTHRNAAVPFENGRDRKPRLSGVQMTINF
jgi:hypothetical protein